MSQQSIVARGTLDDSVLQSLAEDLSAPLERQPPVTAVHLPTGLVTNPGGLVWPHEARPCDLLGGGEPPPQPGRQSSDAENVGEETVADHSPSDDPVVREIN